MTLSGTRLPSPGLHAAGVLPGACPLLARRHRGIYQNTGWQVQAYCLMRNRFRLGLETPNANLVEGAGPSRLGSTKTDLVCWLKSNSRKLAMAAQVGESILGFCGRFGQAIRFPGA